MVFIINFFSPRYWLLDHRVRRPNRTRRAFKSKLKAGSLNRLLAAVECVQWNLNSTEFCVYALSRVDSLIQNCWYQEIHPKSSPSSHPIGIDDDHSTNSLFVNCMGGRDTVWSQFPILHNIYNCVSRAAAAEEVWIRNHRGEMSWGGLAAVCVNRLLVISRLYNTEMVISDFNPSHMNYAGGLSMTIVWGWEEN